MYLLNVTRKTKFEMMGNGMTILSLIPTQFYCTDDIGKLTVDENLDRLGKLSPVHYTIESAFEPVSSAVLKGCSMNLKDGNTVRVHFALGIYCAELAEQKYLLCVKQGTGQISHVRSVMLIEILSPSTP